MNPLTIPTTILTTTLSLFCLAVTTCEFIETRISVRAAAVAEKRLKFEAGRVRGKRWQY